MPKAGEGEINNQDGNLNLTKIAESLLESAKTRQAQEAESAKRTAEEHLRIEQGKAMRLRLVEAIARAVQFPGEQKKADQRPGPALFQKWSECFAEIGTCLRESDVLWESRLLKRLHAISSKPLPDDLRFACVLLLLATESKPVEIAKRLEQGNRDSKLRLAVYWFGYIVDNLWHPFVDETGTASIELAPRFANAQEREQADAAFGWRDAPSFSRSPETSENAIQEERNVPTPKVVEGSKAEQSPNHLDLSKLDMTDLLEKVNGLCQTFDRYQKIRELTDNGPGLLPEEVLPLSGAYAQVGFHALYVENALTQLGLNPDDNISRSGPDLIMQAVEGITGWLIRIRRGDVSTWGQEANLPGFEKGKPPKRPDLKTKAKQLNDWRDLLKEAILYGRYVNPFQAAYSAANGLARNCHIIHCLAHGTGPWRKLKLPREQWPSLLKGETSRLDGMLPDAKSRISPVLDALSKVSTTRTIATVHGLSWHHAVICLAEAMASMKAQSGQEIGDTWAKIPLFDLAFVETVLAEEWQKAERSSQATEPAATGVMNPSAKGTKRKAAEEPAARQAPPPTPPVEALAWTKPNTIKAWAKVFCLGRNAMASRLKEQVFRNKRIGRSRFQIAVDDLPETEKAKHSVIKPAK